jgi:TPR repeat protein
MTIRQIGCRALLLCAVLAPVPAWADLYSAVAAAEKKDFAKAFELYRELAELGHGESQEMLAVMYVNGEGVRRDDVLGYAWAIVARENGGGDSAKEIVDRLAPQMHDAARASIEELKSQFGREALQKTLFPTLPDDSVDAKSKGCRMQAVGNPDDFYPAEARRKGVSGEVLIEAEVYGDGRAHNPRAWYSFPPQVFTIAGRRVALSNRAVAHVVNGVTIPCTLRYKVKFAVHGVELTRGATKDLNALRVEAEAGDPRAQLTYAMIMEGRQDLFEKDQQASAWYLKAAQAGIPTAQYVVGARLLAGFGFEKDERKGLVWLDKAAGAGHADAQLEIANYLIRVFADTRAYAAAHELLERAVKGGSQEAQFYLAAVLATAPDAAERNPTRALELVGYAMDEFGSNPIAFEIRAAAFAQSGDFFAAQDAQSIAVRMAKKLGWNTAPQAARLADYVAGKTWSGNLFVLY